MEQFSWPTVVILGVFASFLFGFIWLVLSQPTPRDTEIEVLPRGSVNALVIYRFLWREAEKRGIDMKRLIDNGAEWTDEDIFAAILDSYAEKRR